MDGPLRRRPTKAIAEVSSREALNPPFDILLEKSELNEDPLSHVAHPRPPFPIKRLLLRACGRGFVVRFTVALTVTGTNWGKNH